MLRTLQPTRVITDVTQLDKVSTSEAAPFPFMWVHISAAVIPKFLESENKIRIDHKILLKCVDSYLNYPFSAPNDNW